MSAGVAVCPWPCPWRGGTLRAGVQRHRDNLTAADRLREHRRRRRRRHGRRAYIRSVYFLPSLATLGNAVCGFGAIYVAILNTAPLGDDPLTQLWGSRAFTYAAYLIFLAMVFDALDGRLARWTRHTTDFGGQLDSLADVLSFGAAPAMLALLAFRATVGDDVSSHFVSRLIWGAGALYTCCAALRLARFNVSNEHGEQHHFSFLGLPSPGAGGAVAGFVIMQQEMARAAVALDSTALAAVATAAMWLLPVVVLGTGLLMVSEVRYPHVVNRYMRGRRSIGRLVAVAAILILLLLFPQYTIGLGTLLYALWGPALWLTARVRRRANATTPQPVATDGAAA